MEEGVWRWKPHYPDREQIVTEESKKSALDIEDEAEDDRLQQVNNLQDLLRVQHRNYYKYPLDGFYINDAMISVMRAIAFEVARLHRSNIAHGNLNPRTVILTYAEGSFIVDISTNQTQGTYADDMYALGLLLAFCIKGGMHPFGSAFDEYKYKVNPEAKDLICRLLDELPDKRPRAEIVVRHPLFWDVRKKIDFLSRANCIVDRVEGNLRVALLSSLKSQLARALDGRGFDEGTVYRTNVICNDATHMYDSGTIGFFLRRMDYTTEGEDFDDEYWMSFCEDQCPEPLLIEVYKVMTKHAEGIARSGIDSMFVSDYLISEHDAIGGLIEFVKKLLIGVCVVGALKNAFFSY